MFGILFTQNSMFGRNTPINAQRTVQNADTTVSFRMIEIITFILEDSRFTQDRKTMSKPLRNEELAMIIFCTFILK